MLTLHAIETLAYRIERAYRRRQPNWRHGCSHTGVWEAAASCLLRLHRGDPTIPVDPELYVAVQPGPAPLADPWEDLTAAASIRRYRGRIRQIVRSLRGELRAEVRRAEARVRHGEAVEAVLRSRKRSLSPLARYIVAYRADRPDLAERFRGPAQEQHRSCPLYREACRRLLPRERYPVLEVVPGLMSQPPVGSSIPEFSLN